MIRSGDWLNSSILVISDSHGDIPAFIAVLEWAKGLNIDEAVFLGDGVDDIAPAAARTGFNRSWHTVRGNGDYQFSIPDNTVLTLPSGRKLFLTHGHRYNVREGYKSLAVIARNAGAEAALFGHTHIPYCGTTEGVFLLNPGSISRPRSNAGYTFAVMECPDSGPCSANFFIIATQSGKIIIRQLELK